MRTSKKSTLLLLLPSDAKAPPLSLAGFFFRQTTKLSNFSRAHWTSPVLASRLQSSGGAPAVHTSAARIGWHAGGAASVAASVAAKHVNICRFGGGTLISNRTLLEFFFPPLLFPSKAINLKPRWVSNTRAQFWPEHVKRRNEGGRSSAS